MPNTRELIAGGIADFLIYITRLPDPLVVGGGYPRDKLITAFQGWLKERDFNMYNADITAWRDACRNGDMK